MATIGKIKIIIHNDIGRKTFQVRFINLSYRIRGRVPRAHKNVNATISVIKESIKSFNIRGVNNIKNKVDVRRLIIIIFMYSAIKIKANAPPLYSVLNPDTNSDSPSEKSNGVRLVSAKVVVNHVKNRTGNIRIKGVICFEKNCRIFKDLIIIRGEIKIRAILTSYEIVWAALRRAPRRAYFEFEAHPAIKVVYTLKLERHKKSKIPNSINTEGLEWGYSAHSIRARNSPSIGATKKGAILAKEGEVNSFVKSFKASARGCGSPASPTLLGPLRNWK